MRILRIIPWQFIGWLDEFQEIGVFLNWTSLFPSAVIGFFRVTLANKFTY